MIPAWVVCVAGAGDAVQGAERPPASQAARDHELHAHQDTGTENTSFPCHTFMKQRECRLPVFILQDDW